MTKEINQKGFASFYVTMLVLAAFLGIGASIFSLSLGEQKIIQNTARASQAYFAAEAGIEDALLRLNKSMTWSSPYTLDVDGVPTTISISSLIGGSRTIAAQAKVAGVAKKVSAVYSLSYSKVSFYYGAQVGDGGMVMGNNSRIKGNVFSNGSVINSAGTAYIENNLIVAGNGNKIQNLEIGDPLNPIYETRAHKCSGSTMHGTLYYVAADGGSSGDCTADFPIQSQPNHIPPVNLPIPDSQIQNWKQEASCNGNPSCIFTGDYTISGGTTETLGPLKIDGNLTLGNNATLMVYATIHVTGDIILNQNSLIQLHSNYGSTSGVIIADGKIKVLNNAIIQGSGQPESYTMLLSTNSSLDEANAAIDVGNSAQGAIFYTTNGAIRLRNSMQIREATGYKLYLDNNAEIEYESGLQNASFSSGPGGSWQVTSWKETP